MAYKKTQEEMDLIIEGGAILGKVLETLANHVKPGVTGKELDDMAEQMIREAGGRPAFKNYQPSRQDPPFPGTICFSLNEEVVHGIPTADKVIKEGDLVSIDIGMQYPVNCGKGKGGNGFFTDTAITVAAGEISAENKQLMAVTQKSLYKGLAKVQTGNTIASIGKAVEDYVDPQGYGIVEDLVGHGVGHDVHEDPSVPNYYVKQLEHYKLEPGVVIAIEPMITIGTHEVEVAEDQWSIRTRDKKMSAHFEHTVVLTADGPVIATQRPSEVIPGV